MVDSTFIQLCSGSGDLWQQCPYRVQIGRPDVGELLMRAPVAHGS